MAVMPQTAGQVRLAVGLLTATEWDWQEGGTNRHASEYLEASTEPVPDLIRGLVIVARAALERLAVTNDMTMSQVLANVAARTTTWE